jgi:ribonuclease P/MRP protein subunit POP3
MLWQEDLSLKTLLDKVPVLTAPWLSQIETSRSLVPTHVKLLKTTAPKDMKAAKELRREGRAKAKERRQAKAEKQKTK